MRPKWIFLKFCEYIQRPDVKDAGKSTLKVTLKNKVLKVEYFLSIFLIFHFPNYILDLILKLFKEHSLL